MEKNKLPEYEPNLKTYERETIVKKLIADKVNEGGIPAENRASYRVNVYGRWNSKTFETHYFTRVKVYAYLFCVKSRGSLSKELICSKANERIDLNKVIAAIRAITKEARNDNELYEKRRANEKENEKIVRRMERIGISPSTRIYSSTDPDKVQISYENVVSEKQAEEIVKFLKNY